MFRHERFCEMITFKDKVVCTHTPHLLCVNTASPTQVWRVVDLVTCSIRSQAPEAIVTQTLSPADPSHKLLMNP